MANRDGWGPVADCRVYVPVADREIQYRISSLKQTTTTTAMAVVYYAYQIASFLIRHVLVPVLLADPRSTMVLIAYVAAYLR